MDVLVLKLKKPFLFEGNEYTSVDLSKMDNWTCDDVVAITKKYSKMVGKDVNPMDAILPEANLEYCQFVAAEASGLPLDFFKGLPAREVGPFKAVILGFFHSET